MVTLTNIHKTYGIKTNAYEAIRGITLSINNAESIAVVGKSGSGKSTLMHLMAGLDSPTLGEIVLDDQNLQSLKEGALATLRNEKFGFVFQQFYLQPSLTVLENVVLPLKIRGISKKERELRAMEMLSRVDLVDKAKNLATDLSGGQKQRVAIARALVSNPQIVFADEPTGNLDEETGSSIINLLFTLQKEQGLTLIIVTHDQDIASKCDRVIHIKDGILQ